MARNESNVSCLVSDIVYHTGFGIVSDQIEFRLTVVIYFVLDVCHDTEPYLDCAAAWISRKIIVNRPTFDGNDFENVSATSNFHPFWQNEGRRSRSGTVKAVFYAHLFLAQ